MQLCASLGGVEIVGYRGHGPVARFERTSGVTARREEQLCPPKRRVAFGFVELNVLTGEECKSRESIERGRAFQRGERCADRVLGGYDAARTAATT